MFQPRQIIESRLRARLKARGYRRIEVVLWGKEEKYPLWRILLGLVLFCVLSWVALVLLIYLGLDIASELSQSRINFPWRFY